MVEICANGQVIRYQSTLTSIRSMYSASKLSSRDMRLLRSSTPFLAPRQGYMLFDFGELRGILQHDRLILIGADLPAVGALGAEIQRRLEQDRAVGNPEDEAPFEVRALECMLEQVYSVFEETLKTLSVLVSSTLRDLTNPQSSRTESSEGRREAALSRLLPLRISLSALQARSRRVSVLLDEILDSEDDVSDMCLTFLHSRDAGNWQVAFDEAAAAGGLGGAAVRETSDGSSRSGGGSGDGGGGGGAANLLDDAVDAALLGGDTRELSMEVMTDGAGGVEPRRWSDLGVDFETYASPEEAEEAAAEAAAELEAAAAEKAEELMETLLDVYDARLNSLTDQIEQLVSTIENTQDVLELTLDNERNRIARLELLLSMAGLCIGTCSAVSGFFGMNLLSGVESTAGLFLLVTGSSILLTGTLFVTCWRQFRSISRRQRDRLMDVDALKNVLGKLDLVSLLLRNRPPLPLNRKLMREEVRQLLQRSAIPMNTRELSVLCGLLYTQQQQQQQQQQQAQALRQQGLTIPQ